jgi:hypothetical protein
MQASTQFAKSSTGGGAQGDTLVQAFHQACAAGDTDRAASLLGELDILWLGKTMAFREREQALRALRQLRALLDKSRKRGPFRWH